jgi:uncharacterized protein
MLHLDKIKSILFDLKPELTEKYGISSIGLFGSIVRDDFSGNSDIIVDFSKPIGIEFIDLADLLERRLQRKVDIVSKNGTNQRFYYAIKAEIIYV